MVKKIRVMSARYKDIHLPTSDAKRVRGFFADLDRNDAYLHNHTEEGKQVYGYPLVQYKVLNQNPVIVAAEEGIRSIHPHLMQEKELTIGSQHYEDMALTIQLSELPIGDSRERRNYQFLTPWLALNQENYNRYQISSQEEKDLLLERILTGNILSMCKRFGIVIEQPLCVVHQMRGLPVLYKGKIMEGFIGTFQVNSCIPNLFGLGKGTARGYGTVKLLKDQELEEKE